MKNISFYLVLYIVVGWHFARISFLHTLKENHFKINRESLGRYKLCELPEVAPRETPAVASVIRH
jgi:hypothetical protein